MAHHQDKRDKQDGNEVYSIYRTNMNFQYINKIVLIKLNMTQLKQTTRGNIEQYPNGHNSIQNPTKLSSHRKVSQSNS